MNFRRILTRHASGERLDRHRHRQAYAAVVIEGGYRESGDRGRLCVAAGHVVFHRPYEAHCNLFSDQGAVVLNLPMDHSSALLARVVDPDEVVRLAERDIRAACEYLGNSIIADDDMADDWPDQLARRLIANPDLDLGMWESSTGLAPRSLSRGFRQLFGVTPKRFRAEQRVPHAFAYRENGIAGHLLGTAKDAAMARRVKALSLSTQADNHVARALYERESWILHSRFVQYQATL